MEVSDPEGGPVGAVSVQNPGAVRSSEPVCCRPALYTAESRLISALVLDGERQQGRAHSERASASESLARASGARVRASNRESNAAESAEAISLVRSLGDPTVAIGSSSTGFSRLRDLSERRQRSHHSVLRQFQEDYFSLCDSLEKSILSQCQRLQDDLSAFDRQLAGDLLDLNDDSLLSALEFSEVESRGVSLCSVLSRRKESIVAAVEGLEQKESDRQQTVTKRLESLIGQLTEIGFVVKEEVHRIAEERGHELNMTVLTNLKDILFIRTNFLKDQLALEATVDEKYAKRVSDWRLLKHEAMIAKYNSYLEANEVSFPTSQRELLEAIRCDMLRMHAKRLPMLKELFLLPIDQIVTPTVSKYNDRLSTLNAEEAAAVQKGYKSLESDFQKRKDELLQLQEKLRRSLHSYHALSDEPDFRSLHDELESLMGTSAMVENLRKFGNMSKELKLLSDGIVQPLMIYNKEVRELLGHLRFILLCSELKQPFIDSGLQSDKDTCLGTLERLRTCKRVDIPPLMGVLIKQSQSLTILPNAPAEFKEQLDDCIQKLQILEESMQSGPFEKKSTAPGQQDRQSLSSSKVSVRSGFSRRSGLSASSKSSKATQLSQNLILANNLDISEFRSVTRQLTFILTCSDLSDGMKQYLRKLSSGMEDQIRSNELIDESIANKYKPQLEKKFSEFDAFAKSVGLLLQQVLNQTAEECTMIGEFFFSLALCREEHLEDSKVLDYSFEDHLTAQLDDFEFSLKQKNQEFEDKRKLLSRSSTLEKCDELFKDCLSFLDEVEQFYREYHSHCTEFCDNYVSETETHMDQFQKKLESTFQILLSSRPIPPEFLPPPKAQTPEVVPVDDKRPKSGKGDVSANKTPKSSRSKKTVGGAPVLLDDAPPLAPTEPEKPLLPSVTIAGSDFLLLTDPLEFTRDSFEFGYKEHKKREQERLLREEEERLAKEEADRLLEEQQKKGGKKKPVAADVPAPVAEAEESKSPEQREEAPEASMVFDPDGKPCVEIISISKESLCSDLQQLRDRFLESCLSETAQRLESSTELTTRKKSRYTHDLEVQLREHWPKRGKTEMETKEPRISQIINHNQVYQRFIRGLVQKNSSHDSVFQGSLKTLRSKLDEYNLSLDQLLPMVSQKQNLSELSGMETRGRELVDSLSREKQKSEVYLGKSLEEDPETLRKSCQDLVSRCKLFDEGDGDYTEDEIREIRTGIDIWLKGLDEMVAERRHLRDALWQQVDYGLSRIKAYEEELSKRVLDVSLRDGSGKKFGAPRRSLQEKYNKEIHQSKEAQSAIDQLLCSLQSQVQYRQQGSSQEKDPLSMSILKTVFALRSRVLERAQYLSILKKADVVSLTPVPLTDEPPSEGTVSESVFADPHYVFPSVTFSVYVKRILEECKEDTKALYKSVGKESALGPTGVTESLQSYLKETESRSVDFRDESSLYFRSQLRQLSSLCEQSATAVFGDLQDRFHASLESLLSSRDAELERTLSQLESTKQQILIRLKPSLRSKNLRSELDALLSEESQRLQSEEELLHSSQHSSQEAVVQCVHSYGQRVLHAFKVLFRLLDTLLYDSDLVALRGDDSLVPPPQSLKKLLRKEEKMDSGTFSTPERLRRKTWKGVELAELSLPDGIRSWMAPFVERETPMDSLAMASAAAGGKGGKDAAKKTAAAAGSKGSAALKASSTPSTPAEGRSQSVDGFVTQGHRRVYEKRNEAFRALGREMASRLQSMDRFFSSQRDRCAEWRRNWERSVQELRE